MDDGTELSADVFLPDGPGPHPAILVRTPYEDEGHFDRARALAAAGFAVVVQDVRGRFDSDGRFEALVNEGSDGLATQRWMTAQRWSDGTIATSGMSYMGWTQLATAAGHADGVRCMAVRVMAFDPYSGWVYPGGALSHSFAYIWSVFVSDRTTQDLTQRTWRDPLNSLPLRDAGDAVGRELGPWKTWLSHPTKDAYWEALDVERRAASIDVPILGIAGWYDQFAPSMFSGIAALRARGAAGARESRLICGPWDHWVGDKRIVGEVDFGGGALVDLDDVEQRWFERWLADRPSAKAADAPYRLFIMGSNTWRDEQEWPLARTEFRRFHLRSAGHANSLDGDGRLSLAAPTDDEAPDVFAYDPANPVPTVGGANCCYPEIVAIGPYDQRAVETRHDVLCYTTTALAEDLEVTGPVHLELYAATDGPDTDWTAKLVDIDPQGVATNLCDGILRARYRAGFARADLLEPGRWYEFRIELGVTANVFRRGHCIRLEVSSSNFPRFDRNPNTGESHGDRSAQRVAHQRIFHDQVRASALILPVIPN